MNQLLRNTLQMIRFLAERSGYKINKAEAFAFPDQAELIGVRDVETIFDIGANNGSITATYRKMFPSSTVYCFEALPELSDRLETRFAEDEKIIVCPIAIADSIGKRQFHVNISVDTSSLLRSSIESIPLSYRSIQTAEKVINVECRTIDSICRSRSISKIDILKMDIQGGELAALHGASNMLTGAVIELIYTEVWFLPFYENQPLFGDISNFLTKFGYSLYGIYNAGFSGSTGRMTWADAIFVSPQIRSRAYGLLKAKHGA